MTEIKVNNCPEILEKIKELVAQDKNWKLVEEYWMIMSSAGTKKPRQGVKLMKIGESIDIYCEVEEAFIKGGIAVDKEKMKEYLKWVEEAEKIISRDSENYWPKSPPSPISSISPTEPQEPQETDDIRDKNIRGFSSRFAGCPDLEAAKKFIKEYYQENQTEIQKNPDFARWISVKKNYKISEEREFMLIYVGNPTKYPSDLSDWQKEFYDKLDYFCRNELTLSLGDRCQDIDEVERELKNCWNSLLENKENQNTPSENSTNEESENKPAKTPTNKNKIEQLKSEIKALENNPELNDNSQKQEELQAKKKKLEELEKANKDSANTSSNKSNNSKLPVYLGIGVIILLVSGVICIWVVRRKDKKK